MTRDSSQARRGRSISLKLMWLVLASVGAAIAIVTGVSAWRDGERETRAEADRLHRTAALLASLADEPTTTRDARGVYEVLRSIRLMPDVTYARVMLPNGRALAETGSGVRLSRDVSVDQNQRATLWSLVASQSIEVRAPIVHGGRRVGEVLLLGRTEGVGQRLAGSLLFSLLAGLVAAVVGLLIAGRLQRQIVRPILALKGSMSHVRETYAFDSPVEVAADDEIGELVEGFNAMLGEIRQRDATLSDHMAGLERTVAERTADLREAKEAAEAANHAKSDFLATMSHEIRTPMNGIMVMAEMLAASEAPPKQRRFAEVIARSGSSLLAIINDILDFSKIEAGKMELEAVEVDPADIAEDVCSLFWERARAKNLDLAAYIDPATPSKIQGDPVRLRQVVGNLVNNAIKFTEQGGVLVQMGVTADGRLRVAVQDSGIGIPQDKISGLFGAFTQVDQSTTRKFGGTGLGLAICKRLVEAMGGAFQVRSELGKGSTFAFTAPMTVLEPAPEWPQLEDMSVGLLVEGPCTRASLKRYLAAAKVEVALEEDLKSHAPDLIVADAEAIKTRPLAKAPVLCLAEYGDATPQQLVRDGRAQAAMLQPLRRRDLVRALQQAAAGEAITDPDLAEKQEVRAATPSFAGARVLVVDDSAVNREVALEALSRLDIHADVACDGAEGVQAVATGNYDLVLMDGSMPVMDGYEAAKAIRAEEEGQDRRLPIVALTAHVVGDAAEQWREAGMDDVLHKPFTLNALAAVLGRFLTAKPRAESPAALAPAAPVDPEVFSELMDPEVCAELQRMASGGKADFVERVRRLYRENAPKAVESLMDAAEANDAEAATRAAHSLKSMSLNIGARAVAELAAQIEHRGRTLKTVDRNAGAELSKVLRETLLVIDAPAAGVVETARPSRAKMIEQLPADDQALARDLEAAIEAGDFRLVYQPQFDRDGTQIIGCESLIRWNHPTRPNISPAQFIPLAERAGLIRPITRWALLRAMEDTATLGIPVAVNASAHDIAAPEFPDELAVLLARQGFDPGRMEIEITETAVLGDADVAQASIQRLHEIGASVAMDDFGVGFSSLNHLRLYPFDKLKIDRVFISRCDQDVPSAALVHAVVSVGRALGMKVIAEGVETEGQRKFLRVCGVHALQGYLLGRPMPIEDLRKLIDAQTAAAKGAVAA
jgi:EAL domain-containing protein (putative c-di-GMP-specific phosphodiesterase class I)/signal transduction histidine kinase/CheY-like chemotaxis protein